MSPVERMAELREAASAAMRRAYAPYSGFRVGAALLGTDGVIYTGCNVENSSFPAGICAERNALVAAVNAGRLEFAHLVIVAGSDSPVPPCGLCRQALVEFAPELPITSVGARGMTETWSLAELLPAPFTGDSLRRG